MKIKKIMLATAILVSLGISGNVEAREYVPGGYWEGGIFFATPPTPPQPPTVNIPQNDIVSAMQKDIKLKLVAPTDLRPIPNANFNLAGVQTQVNPIEKTKLVNNIDPNSFSQQDIGAIAVNNTEQHVLAANSFVPVGAANMLEQNNEFTALGAAYKVNNKDEQSYDFVISEPILE